MIEWYTNQIVLDGIRIWTRADTQNSYVKKISDDNVRSSQNCKEPRDADWRLSFGWRSSLNLNGVHFFCSLLFYKHILIPLPTQTNFLPLTNRLVAVWLHCCLLLASWRLLGGSNSGLRRWEITKLQTLCVQLLNRLLKKVTGSYGLKCMCIYFVYNTRGVSIYTLLYMKW